MNIKMIDIKNTFIKSYFLISIILFSFFVSQDSYVAENVIVPHVKLSPLYIHFFLTIFVIVFLIILIKKNTLVIDSIFVFLLLRIFSSIIPVFYIYNAVESIGLITIPIVSALAYFIGRQFSGEVKSIIRIQMIFLIILSTQTIYTVANMVVPNIIYYYQKIRIPIGSSNLIAAYLVPCFMILFFSKGINKYVKYLVTSISLLAIFQTTSVGAILILVTLFIIHYFYLNIRISMSVKIISIFAIFIAFIFVLGMIVNYNYSLSDLTHQRSDLIISDLLLWRNHLFFGNGMVYDNRGSGTHNILVDLLVQNGIVGFTLYITPVLIVLKRVILSNSHLIFGLTMYLIATLLHSLIETSYFNYTGDMLFWFMCGISIAQIKLDEKKNLG